MFPSNPLLADLPLMLQVEMQRALLPDETLLASLPGTQGEAFVLTSRRAIIIRDKGDSVQSRCETYAYPLATVQSAEAKAHSTGGYLELDVRAEGDPENRKVYYPRESSPLFEAAAAKVGEAISMQATSAPAAPKTSGAQAAEGACHSCAAPIESRSVYCSSCGAQVRDICANCGVSSPAGSVFCSACGRNLIPAIAKCSSCGEARAYGTTYCTSCGTLMMQQCLACGATVAADWKYCGICGRMLGSDRMDPHGSHAAQRRLREMRDRQEANQQPETTARYPVTPEATSGATAETHNENGLELLENENYDAAIAEFREAIALDPDASSYHYNLAVALDEADRDDEALVEYQAALKLDPRDTGTLLALGYMYSENDNAEEAVRMWQRVIDIAPGSADAQEADNNIRNQGSL